MEKFRSFYVNGELKSPGAYPYQPDLTVRKMISLASGFSENSDENKLSLIKAKNISKDEARAGLGQREILS